MDEGAPRAGRLRSGRLAVASLVVVVVFGACGSPSEGGPGSGGGGEAEARKIVAATQAAFGTSMVAGELQGDTIVITLVNGFGAGGAGLFMCSTIKLVREKYDPGGSLKMIMVDQSGEELASSTACK